MLQYFSKLELMIWSCSVVFILISFGIFDRENYMILSASIIGVTSLIFSAKGHPFGQFLMIMFSLLYGMISYTFAYYGEMLTYLGMTMPMAVLSFVSWMKNPYEKSKSEVKVNRITRKETAFMWITALIVTIMFYFILDFFHTANMLPSTLSVTTSFLAVFLTYKRSPYYAVAYAANDMVLILLWLLASMTDSGYFSVVVCFIAFFVNDMYGFFCWRKMEKRQRE